MEVFIPEEQFSTEHESEIDCNCEDCIKDEMGNEQDTVALLSQPPNDSQTTNPIPQLDNSSIATQELELEDQSHQLETTEEIGETSMVRRSSRVKRKTHDNSTPTNSAEQESIQMILK